MNNSTRYRVSIPCDGGPLYFTALKADGCPVLWTRTKSRAPLYSRDEAEAVASRLGEYLTAYGEAAAADARKIKVRPATGGHATGYRFTPSN